MPDQWGRPTFDDGLNMGLKALQINNAISQQKEFGLKMQDRQQVETDKQYQTQAARIAQEEAEGLSFNADENARMKSQIPADVMQSAESKQMDYQTKKEAFETERKIKPFLDEYQSMTMEQISKVDPNKLSGYQQQGYIKAMDFHNKGMQQNQQYLEGKGKADMTNFKILKDGTNAIKGMMQSGENDAATSNIVKLVDNSPFGLDAEYEDGMVVMYRRDPLTGEKGQEEARYTPQEAVGFLDKMQLKEYGSLVQGERDKIRLLNNENMGKTIIWKDKDGNIIKTTGSLANTMNPNERYFHGSSGKKGDGFKIDFEQKYTTKQLREMGYEQEDLDREKKVESIRKEKSDADLSREKADYYKEYNRTTAKSEKAPKPISEQMANLVDDFKKVKGVDADMMGQAEIMAAIKSDPVFKVQYLNILKQSRSSSSAGNNTSVPQEKPDKKPEPKTASDLKAQIDGDSGDGELEPKPEPKKAPRGGRSLIKPTSDAVKKQKELEKEEDEKTSRRGMSLTRYNS